MKHLTLKNIGSSFVLIAGMAAYSAAYAHGDEKHDAAPAPKTETPSAAGMEQQIPATADGIWKAIDDTTAELQKIIKNESLGDVHHLAFAVRDLAATLPEHSKELPADKIAKVKSSVKFVATLAERLDATGDAKDKAGTQANFTKLKKVLEGMRANYSAPKAK